MTAELVTQKTENLGWTAKKSIEKYIAKLIS
jgi:hypothetical protein